MFKSSMLFGSAGLLLVIILCWATSADARHRRYYSYDRFSDPYAETQRHGDRYRHSRRNRGEERMQRGGERMREAPSELEGESGRGRRGAGIFSAVVEQLIRVCGQQGAELKNSPFDWIAQTVRPDDRQRGALEELRRVATETADTLAADCPREIPAAPAAQIEEAQRGMETAIAAIKTVQPAIKTFYAALDDEQKARLVAKSITAGMAQYTSGRRNRVRPEPAGDGSMSATRWDSICANWAAALRDWPVARNRAQCRSDGDAAHCLLRGGRLVDEGGGHPHRCVPDRNRANAGRSHGDVAPAARGHASGVGDDPSRARAVLRGAR